MGSENFPPHAYRAIIKSFCVAPQTEVMGSENFPPHATYARINTFSEAPRGDG